ncbi:MAG: hypothetical protein IH964_11860 [Candidatus Dadabacteria bacterium]|nr:hypothetical protein [Candidatus Dadabacteria bacterium]
MRFSTIVGIFTVMLMLVTGLVFAEHVIDDSKEPRYLFTLASKSGTFEGDTLTLKGIPLVVYFSDRPVRVAGHITLEKFAGMWDKGVNSFKADPPNAELAIYDKKGDKHAVLIISRPEIKEDTISFKVRLISGSIPKSLGHSALFVDGGGVNPQITDFL